MKRLGIVLSGALLLGGLAPVASVTSAQAQYGGGYDRGYRSARPYDDRYDRDRYRDRNRAASDRARVL